MVFIFLKPPQRMLLIILISTQDISQPQRPDFPLSTVLPVTLIVLHENVLIIIRLLTILSILWLLLQPVAVSIIRSRIYPLPQHRT